MESVLCEHKKHIYIYKCDVVFAAPPERQNTKGGGEGALLSESDFQGQHFNGCRDRNEWHQIVRENTHTHSQKGAVHTLSPLSPARTL